MGYLAPFALYFGFALSVGFAFGLGLMLGLAAGMVILTAVQDWRVD